MTFYCTREKDGTIHVQNAVMGMMGQHHVHTPEDFKSWYDMAGLVSLIHR
jgi:hypothetical protein